MPQTIYSVNTGDKILAADHNTLVTFLNQLVINVKDYGAVGDGVADDTTAINNAIAAIPAAGGVVFFPPGTYKITTLTKLTKPMRFIGSGRSVTFIKSSASVGIQVGDGTANTYIDISIEDLTIQPTGATPTKALYLAGGANSSSYLSRTVLNRVNIDATLLTAGAVCDGVYVDGFVLNLWISQCNVVGFGNFMRDLISVQSLAITNVQNVTISQTYCSNPSRNSLNLQRILQLAIIGSEFDSNGSNAVQLLGVAGFSITGSILRQNVATAPVFLGVVGGSNTIGGIIEGCYLDNGGIYKMISANGTANIVIKGCQFVQLGTVGPFLSGDSGTNVGWSVEGVSGITSQVPFWSPPSMVTSPGTTLVGQGNNATVPQGATNYLGVGYTGIAPGGILDYPMPSPGVLQVLQVLTVGAQPAGGSLVFTIMKNTVATTLTFTIAAGAAGGTYSDLTNQVVYAQGDLIELRVVNNAPAAASGALRGWSVQAITLGSLS